LLPIDGSATLAADRRIEVDSFISKQLGFRGMKLRGTPAGLIAQEVRRWVHVDYDGDLLTFLAEPAEVRAAALTTTSADPGRAGVPFQSRSLRVRGGEEAAAQAALGPYALAWTIKSDRKAAAS
jgi:hypothetical protein